MCEMETVKGVDDCLLRIMRGSNNELCPTRRIIQIIGRESSRADTIFFRADTSSWFKPVSRFTNTRRPGLRIKIYKCINRDSNCLDRCGLKIVKISCSLLQNSAHINISVFVNTILLVPT